MWNSRTNTILLALVICASIASASVSVTFSDADREAVHGLLSKALSNDKLASLKTVYQAVEALKALSLQAPGKDDICTFAKSALNDAKSAEDIFYSVSILENLGCGETVSKSVIGILETALGGTNLEGYYFAISAASVLSKVGHGSVSADLIKSLPAKIADLVARGGEFYRAKDDPTGYSSVYHAALAVAATARVVELGVNDETHVGTVASELESLIKEAHYTDRPVMSLEDERESELTTTSIMLRGALDLFRAAKPENFPLLPLHVNKIAEYFLRNKEVHSVEQAYALATALAAISRNSLHTPLALTVSPRTLSAAAKASDASIKVRLTDIYGRFATRAKVVLVRASSGTQVDSARLVLSNQNLVPADEKDARNTLYSLNFLASKPDKGYYALEFRVVPEDSAFSTIDSAVRIIKVVTAVSVSEAELSITETREEDPDAVRVPLEVGKKHKDVLEPPYEHYFHLSFRVKNSVNGRLTQVHQAFLRFTNVATGQETFLVAHFHDKAYHLLIVCRGLFALMGLQRWPELTSAFRGASGLYHADLIIGDPFITNPLTWRIADFKLKFPETNQTQPEPLLAPKPQIQHIFRPPDKRAPDQLALTFSGLVLSPWLVYLIGLFAVGANLRRFPTSGLDPIVSFAFLATFGAILGTLVIYWLRLNIFQCVGYLLVLAIPAVLFGRRALRVVGIKEKTD